jgi:hypothetical protein
VSGLSSSLNPTPETSELHFGSIPFVLRLHRSIMGGSREFHF